MRLSFRLKFSVAFLAVAVCTGALASVLVDRKVAGETQAQLEERLSYETIMLGQMTATALFGDVDPTDSSLDEPVHALADAVHTQLAIVARDGTVVADSARTGRGAIAAAGRDPEIVQAGATGRGTTIRDGRMFVARSIVRDGQVLGYARASIPLAQVRAEVREVRKGVAFALVLAVLVAMLLGPMMAGRVLRPLRALAEGVARVGKGDYDKPVPITSRDELADVASAFNGMSRSMRDAIAARDQRNEELRLVLDNVGQGLLTIDRRGHVARERSAVVDQWLGAIEPGTPLWDVLARIDAHAAVVFRLNWEALVEGVMPEALCTDQLPRRATASGRRYALEYRLLGPEDAREGMLVVISDVTAARAAEEHEAEQRALVHVLERAMRDRAGFYEFLEESRLLVARICGAERAPFDVVRRWLHTLKGNTSLFGVDPIAALCHELEDTMLETGVDLTPAQRELLGRRWKEFGSQVGVLLGDGAPGALAIDPAEYEEVLAAARRGAPRAEIVPMIESWRLERATDRLERVAEQARALAARLGKGPIRVILQPGQHRFARERMGAFWAAFAHVVRNAISHGLETAEERVVAGKSPEGCIRIAVRRHDDTLTVEFADDGRGIDWRAVASRARALGLRAVTEDDLVAAIFHDGLTTGVEATETSGRGIGMGAVRAECEALGGTVGVQSERGRGTVLRFSFPARAVTERGPRRESASARPAPAPSAP